MSAHRAGLRHAVSALAFVFEPLSRDADFREPEHPLAQALDLLRVLLRQSLATAGVLAVVVVGTLRGVEGARLLLVPSFVVQLGLALLLAVAVARVRKRAEDLIADGRDGLPLPLLSRQRERLLDRRQLEALARAFDDLVLTAAHWHKTLRGYRPVFNVQLVRAVAPDLLAIAVQLRAEITDAGGVVLAKRLLTSGSSPLYGTDIDALRAALWRIHGALISRVGPTSPDSRSPPSAVIGTREPKERMPPCAECGRVPRDEADAERWRFDSDGTGDLLPFCPECAEREFGLSIVEGS